MKMTNDDRDCCLQIYRKNLQDLQLARVALYRSADHQTLTHQHCGFITIVFLFLSDVFHAYRFTRNSTSKKALLGPHYKKQTG
jgi:hypothetical protein